MDMKPICPTCSSAEILFDAHATWFEGKAELKTAFTDKAESCEGCGAANFIPMWQHELPKGTPPEKKPDVKAELKKILAKISLSYVGAWNDNLTEAIDAIITEDFDNEDSTNDKKYNGWLEDLQNLMKKL